MHSSVVRPSRRLNLLAEQKLVDVGDDFQGLHNGGRKVGQRSYCTGLYGTVRDNKKQICCHLKSLVVLYTKYTHGRHGLKTWVFPEVN